MCVWRKLSSKTNQHTFLLHSFYTFFPCIFGEQGDHSCTVAQSQVVGLCTHISTELKIKFSTRQAEAGCATQYLQARAHSYLKPACSLASKLLARGTNNPVGPAITSLVEQQNWLEGMISWASLWSLYLSTSQQMIPSAVPYLISFIQACFKCCICGA